MGTNPAHPSDHQQQHMLDTHNSVAVPGQTNHSSPFLATPAPAQHVQPYHDHPAHSLQQFTRPAPVLQPSTAAAGHIPVSHTGTHAADTAVDINSWLHNPASIPQSPEKELATQQQLAVAVGAHVLPTAAASATAARDQVNRRSPGNGVLTAAVPGSSPADEPPTGSVNPDRPAAAIVSSQPAVSHSTHDASAAGLTGLPTKMAQPLSGSAATDARGSPAATAQHDDSRQLQHQQQAPAVGKATPSPPPATAAPPTAPAVSPPLPVTAAGQNTPPPTSTAAAVFPVTAAAATPVASATPPQDPPATAAAATAGTPPPTAAGDPAPAAATTPAATPPPAATATGGGGGGGHRKQGRKHPKQPPPGAKNQLKGVFWDRKTGRWRSQLGYHNKKIFMGYFNTPQEAAVAYDKKAVELHGMLAKTNFPIQNYLQLLPEGGSALPTAEMAIPVAKKHTDTPTTAADGEGVSLHNSAKPHAAAAAVVAAGGGGAAASVDGSVGGSEGQGFSIGGNASEGLATGGDDSSMQDPQQHQQQQQRQRAAGSGDGSQGFAEGHSQGMSPATAAAAATGSDGGVDVPVLPAAAEGGFAVSAPAERPARKKRKSAGAAATDHAQFATAAAADAAFAGLDMNSGVLNATGGVGMMTNPRPPVAPGSRQQQQQGVSHPGVTSTRGRGSGRRGAPRGPRPRGRPRSVISHQVAPGWDRSSGPEEDYVNQDYVNPGMQYRETQNTNHQYQDLEGYVNHMGAANHDHHDQLDDVIDHTSGSGDMMMLEQHLQGMASADISAAQALAGLLQLGEVKDEPDVQGYPSLPEQQRRQQPGYQEYNDEDDNRSWYEHQAPSRGYSRGLGSRESQGGQHGVYGQEGGTGYKRSKRSSRMTHWQQQHDSGHGYSSAAADDEDGAEPATWSPQQHYSGGSRSGRHVARYPTTAAATNWQQQQPYHEAGDEYAAAAAAAVNPWIPRGHALRSGGLAGYWGSGYRQDNTAGYQMLGSDAAAAAAAGGGESQHGYGRGKCRSKKQRGLQYDNQPTAAAAAGAMNHWQQHSGDDEAAWEHAAAAALAALPAAGRHSRQLPAAAAVQGEEDEDEGKTPGFDQLMQAVQAAIAESSMEQQQRQQRQWQQQQQQSPSSNAVSPTQMDMLQQLKELLQSHHQVLRQDYQPVRQQLTAAELEREQAAAAAAAGAGAGSRVIGDSPHSLVTMLSSVLSPRAAAAAAAPMQADTHLTAAATPLAAEYAAAAAPSVVTGDDLIDEALLLLPPDQQDIINQQPALKALLGKLVGGSQISGTAAQHRPKQQQQYGLQRSSVAQGPSLLSQTLNAADTPTAATAAATSPPAAAARQHPTGPASILSAMRPPVSKQPDPAAAASHPASYPAAAAAGGPPTQSGFKRKFSGSGFGSSHSHTRPSSGNARGNSEVNPGGVTFRKGQSKPLKLWGSAGQGSVSGASGQGSGKPLSPGSSKGFGSFGLLSPAAAAAAAAAARSSSSAPGERSVITSAADQQLQLPQLVPLPELKTQPEQQQQQQEQGSDELGRLVAALLGVVKPESAAAAAPADQVAGASPAAAAAVGDGIGHAATEQAAYHQMNGNTFSSSPQAAASNAPGSGRGWNAATAPAAASSTPLGPITPAPQQQQQQQSVNHFIYIPPGTSMSPAAAAMTPMHTPQPTSAAAAAPGGNRSGVIKGGYHALHGRSLPKSSTDMSATLSFREWQTPKTAAAAAAVATPSRMQRSSAAAAATPGAFDPSVLRQSALAALQAANQAVTAGDAPGNAAAAAAMDTTADKQQLQRMLHDLGLQLHVLAPHAMMLPDELQQLQQAAAAAIGSSGVGGSSSCSGSGEGLSSSAVLSCVAALPSVLSGGGGVSADVWDKVNACVTAAADDDDEDDNKPAAAAGVAVKDEEDYGSEVAVKVHLEVMGNQQQQQQQQQRRLGHLVLLPIVVPLAASSFADDTAAAAAADNNLQVQTDDMQIDTATEAAATAPALQQPQQQQQQEEDADQTQESSDLARLPPLLRQKLLQLRDQIQEMQGGVLRPEQDVNWLLKLMVAAMRRKVQAKQQQLQQQSMQQQQQGLGSSRTIQTSIYSDPGAAAAANTVTPAVTGPAAAAASLARSSSSGGGGRTVTTGVATGAGDIGRLLAGAAAAGLLGRGSGSEGMTR